MCRPFLIVAALVVCVSAVPAGAQCTLPHPKSAKKFSTSLVSAFTYCGVKGFNDDRTPNTTTEGGVPACKPPETFDQLAGNPPGGWRWDEFKGQGQVQLKAVSTFPADPHNPPDTTDVTILLKLKGVRGVAGPIDGTSGSFVMLLRVTFDDRAGGNMTVVDFPLNTSFQVQQGKAKLKTSVDTVLNGINQPGLPHCTSIEIAYVAVLDQNVSTFAVPGQFLP